MNCVAFEPLAILCVCVYVCVCVCVCVCVAFNVKMEAYLQVVPEHHKSEEASPMLA